MGHLVGKDAFHKLSERIENQNIRIAGNQTFYTLLKELYTEEEAELATLMPYGLASLKEVAKALGHPAPHSVLPPSYGFFLERRDAAMGESK